MKKYLYYLVFRVARSKGVSFDENSAWQKVMSKCKYPQRKIYNKLWILYAASFALVMTIAGVLFFSLFKNNVADQAPIYACQSSNVELILVNGEKMNLQNVEKYVAQDLNISLTRDTANGRIIYKNTKGADNPQYMTNNKLVVPKGRTFSFVLPDSSKVLLNSETVLEFPVSFSADSRTVYLKGEAYFEVAHNSKAPFRVITGKNEIQVLGTIFNVSAYPDEIYCRTTLIEGKVSVLHGEKNYLLHPSEECTIDNQTGEISIKEVDSFYATSWIDGKYFFKNCRFEEIILKLQRLYDFDVDYINPEIKDMKFRGFVDKKESLMDNLQMFEKTGAVYFEMYEHTLYVNSGRR